MTKHYTWETVPCQEGAGFTLRENISGQLMHSAVGPWIEANAVYVAQSEFERRADRGSEGELVIYDVGMGIAANALAAFSALEGELRPIRVISFEEHPEALSAALNSPDKFGFLTPFAERIRSLLEHGQWTQKANAHVPSGRASWGLMTGDFRDTDLSELPPADLIYFDFYAPSAAPELWTTEVFSRLIPKLKLDGLLITYSSTKAVRAALLLAGFFVGQGASTTMKKETTVASRRLSLLRDPLGASWLAGFERSPSRTDEFAELIRSHPQFSGR